MKQFLLFGGYKNGPNGGWRDFHGDFDTIHEAQQKSVRYKVWYCWYQIIDIRSGNIVESFRGKDDN